MAPEFSADAPHLPPPGPADAPSLPMPSPARPTLRTPTLPAPTATTTLAPPPTAGTAHEVAPPPSLPLPTLPAPAGAAPSAEASDQPYAGSPPLDTRTVPAFDDPAAHASPHRPHRRPRRRFPTGLVLGAFAALVVGVTAYVVVTGDPGDASRNTAPAPPSVPDLRGPAAGERNVTGVLDDAGGVVEAIEENTGEEEALDLLGLDETGRPLAAEDAADSPEPTIAAGAVAGYRFAWTDPSGQDLDVVVDTTTGDYAVEASDGIRFRRVDGTFVGADSGDGDWVELAADPFGDIPVIGIDEIPTDADVLSPTAAPYILSDTTEGPVRILVIDDAAFGDGHPIDRVEWLRPWGLLDSFADQPATPIEVRIAREPSSGRLVTAQLTGTAIGGTATLTVIEVYDEAPSIENPLSDAN